MILLGQVFEFKIIFEFILIRIQIFEKSTYNQCRYMDPHIFFCGYRYQNFNVGSDPNLDFVIPIVARIKE